MYAQKNGITVSMPVTMYHAMYKCKKSDVDVMQMMYKIERNQRPEIWRPVQWEWEYVIRVVRVLMGRESK